MPEGGAGYEVSPSHAAAAALAASQNASTVFIFGDKNTLDQIQDQTADASATATASRGGAESQTFGDSPGVRNFGNNLPLVLAVAGAAVLILILSRK